MPDSISVYLFGKQNSVLALDPVAGYAHSVYTADMTEHTPPGPQVGDPALDFTLESTGGTSITLSNYFGAHRLLLVFYPKDFTSG